MTEETKAIVTEHQKALTSNQLMIQWQILESRKKFLLKHIQRQNSALFRMKYANACAWCDSIRTELEARIDAAFPNSFLNSTIRNCSTFCILEN